MRYVSSSEEALLNKSAFRSIDDKFVLFKHYRFISLVNLNIFFYKLVRVYMYISGSLVRPQAGEIPHTRLPVIITLQNINEEIISLLHWSSSSFSSPLLITELESSLAASSEISINRYHNHPVR